MLLTLATQNQGKLRELGAWIVGQGLPIAVRSLAESGTADQAEEVGSTFGQNALLKASWAARRTGGWALADDSGLCVDALGGAPGLYSARWSGRGDEANNLLLLERLAGIPAAKRTARYRCALALCHPVGEELAEELLVEAEVEGRILEAPRGTQGFGYDPLFEIPAWGLTFAEVDLSRKETISHRSAALRKLLPLLRMLTRDA
jgi:XTP/dITP diphosphohydrolase